MNINLKNENGNYPILYAINNNNIEMIKCLVEYAKYQNIILRINENDITNPKEVKEDIISLLLDYEDKQIIIIECDNERIFLKKKVEKSNNNEEEEEELPEYSQNQPNYVQYPYIPNFIPNVVPPGMYVPPGGQYVLLPNGQYYFQQFGQPNLMPVNMPPQYNNSQSNIDQNTSPYAGNNSELNNKFNTMNKDQENIIRMPQPYSQGNNNNDFSSNQQL